MAAKWNGKGEPPNKAAAVAWMKTQGVKPENMPYAWDPNSKDKPTGADARQLVAAVKASNTQPAPSAARTTSAPAASSPAPAASSPTAGAAPTSIEAAIAAGPGGSATTDKGYALFPYQGSGAFQANTLQNLKVTDAATGQPIGARYFEADAVAPASWSPEKTAGLQRQMLNLGLYGNAQVKIGSWNVQDQEAYTALLTAANVSGRTSDQQIQEWSIRPPTPAEVAAMSGKSVAKIPPVQLSNPTDIRAAAETASQNVLGHVDQGFVNSAPSAYQGQEMAAGQATIAANTAGTGGTVTQAPTATNFLEDKLQREHPIEADANSFINTFDNFRKILGAQ